MFTGIVEEMGTVRRLNQAPNRCELELTASKVLEGTAIGDSIAVNGVCLTVVRMGEDHFTADVMPETLRRSNLGLLKPGSKVNLERAMAANGRFGGHMVAGHIDGTGKIRSMQPGGKRRTGNYQRCAGTAPVRGGKGFCRNRRHQSDGGKGHPHGFHREPDSSHR